MVAVYVVGGRRRGRFREGETSCSTRTPHRHNSSRCMSGTHPTYPNRALCLVAAASGFLGRMGSTPVRSLARHAIARGKTGGTTSHREQDHLSAMVVFAGAGLDSAMKQLVRDAMPVLTDAGNKDVRAAFEAFAEAKTPRAEGGSGSSVRRASEDTQPADPAGDRAVRSHATDSRPGAIKNVSTLPRRNSKAPRPAMLARRQSKAAKATTEVRVHADPCGRRGQFGRAGIPRTVITRTLPAPTRVRCKLEASRGNAVEERRNV